MQTTHQNDTFHTLTDCETVRSGMGRLLKSDVCKAAQLVMITVNVLKPFRSNFNYSFGTFILLLDAEAENRAHFNDYKKNEH